MTPGELAQLYDAHAAALFAFLLQFTRDEADTRDVLQDVFGRLTERPAPLDGIRDPRGFLLRMAHNRAVDLIRRRESRDRAHAAFEAQHVELFAPVEDADEAEIRRRMADALGCLPPDQRAVVHLRLWEGLTFDAIGDALEIPLQTAVSRYRYGLDKLRAQLRPLYDELRSSPLAIPQPKSQP